MTRKIAPHFIIDFLTTDPDRRTRRAARARTAVAAASLDLASVELLTCQRKEDDPTIKWCAIVEVAAFLGDSLRIIVIIKQTREVRKMGNFLSHLLDRLFASTPARVILIGLDNAGKTTILYKLKLNEVVTTIPTIGFNVDEVTVKNLTMTVWDVGGQTKIRPLWQYYFENNDAVIYAVDSSDQQRLEEAREELFSVLGDDRLRDCALLVLANKQDLPGAATVTQVTEALQLRKLRQRNWFVQGTCAVNGDGLTEGFTWLADIIKVQKKRGNVL